MTQLEAARGRPNVVLDSLPDPARSVRHQREPLHANQLHVGIFTYGRGGEADEVLGEALRARSTAVSVKRGLENAFESASGAPGSEPAAPARARQDRRQGLPPGSRCSAT